MASRPARLTLVVGILIVLAAAGAATLVYSGWYSVAATEQHLRPTYAVLEIGLRRSVERHASGIETPPLDSAQARERGFACFKAHCAQCHGAPGVARADFAQGLLPVPSSLSQAAHDWSPPQLYWITRYGVKMTGMPAWEYRLDDEALWSVVAFLQVLPLLSAPEYSRLAGSIPDSRCADRAAEPLRAANGDAQRGRVAIQQYGCTACHRIPGIVGANAHTGPPLTHMGSRKYIAGVLPYSFENLVRWLLDPQAISPHTAMPDTRLTEVDARDIAAYLERLR
jgi:mono/diheme cytochrome c family protein